MHRLYFTVCSLLIIVRFYVVLLGSGMFCSSAFAKSHCFSLSLAVKAWKSPSEFQASSLMTLANSRKISSRALVFRCPLGKRPFERFHLHFITLSKVIDGSNYALQGMVDFSRLVLLKPSCQSGLCYKKRNICSDTLSNNSISKFV